MKTFFILLALLLFEVIPGFAQDTIHVPADYSTIQAGIDAASTGDIVLVADGTYFENINYKGKAITVASLFLIDGNTSHISNTIINGSQPSHPDSGSVVIFSSGEDTTSVLCGFTITGGTGSFHGSEAKSGGGILCLSSGARIMHNIIENNNVTSNTLVTTGGGISGGPRMDNSWTIIENNIIRNNSVTNTSTIWESGALGAGISLFQNARILNNTIEYNIAKSTNNTAWGGGVLCSSGGQSLERYCINNKIWYNKALSPTGTYYDGGAGGGLVIAGSPKAEVRLNDIRYNEVEANENLNKDSWGAGVVLQNQTSETIFSQNYIAFNKAINNSICLGAGIAVWNYNVTGGPYIINNIITNNTGGTKGGGLFTGGHVSNGPVLINNTIFGNTATQGGAIYAGFDSYEPTHPKIINSLLWNNGSSIFIKTGISVTVRYSDVEGGYSGTGNIDTNPLFADTLFHLANSSPCIGAGIDSIEIAGVWYYAPPTCYFGGPRPNPPGSMPDIGACESPLAIPVGIEDEIIVPTEFSLSQNYPNPFNPLTSIEYRVGSMEYVTLKVFDVLGNEIATLVSEEKPAGRYDVEWNASNYPSGVYFYRLHAGTFIETKKMLLLK